MINTTNRQRMDVLVIEDNPAINRLFCKHLTASGFACQSAESIHNAIEMMTQHGVPKILVLDLELEDGIGTEVLDYLAQHHITDITTIVVSANVYSRRYDLSQYDIEELLIKPISPRELSALVQSLYVYH